MKYIFVIVIFLTSQVLFYGQSVRASVESSDVYLGQAFEFRVIIEGTTDAEVPDLGTIPGINIQYKGASTSMVSSFGMGANNSTKTITYSWSFTATKKGYLLIPSLSINVDGKIYNTASGTINVKEPEPVDGFYLFLESDKVEYWFGEPINLTIKWLFSSSVSNPSFNLPFIKSGKFDIESQNPNPGADVFKLNINGLEVLAMQSAEIYKGDQYSSLSFQLKLVPSAIGEYNIEPISLSFDSAERATGFRTTYKPVVIPSNSIKLKIKDLPTTAYEGGKPVVLSKGNLMLEGDVHPLKMHIGDPLTYTITVKGAISPESVEFPFLKLFPNMENNFSIPERQAPGKVEGDSVSFSQTIRVKSKNVNKIPELSIKYFNIENGKVEMAIVNPIEIDVLETEIVTSENLESTGYTISSDQNNSELITNDEGILYNFSINKLSRINHFNNSLYLMLILLPFFLYITLVIIKYRSRAVSLFEWFQGRSGDFTKQYNLLSANKNLSKDELKKEIYTYLLNYCDCADNSLTVEEITSILQNKRNNREVVFRMKDLLLLFDEAEFSKNKKELELHSMLQEFYTLSMELNTNEE